MELNEALSHSLCLCRRRKCTTNKLNKAHASLKKFSLLCTTVCRESWERRGWGVRVGEKGEREKERKRERTTRLCLYWIRNFDMLFCFHCGQRSRTMLSHFVGHATKPLETPAQDMLSSLPETEGQTLPPVDIDRT